MDIPDDIVALLVTLLPDSRPLGRVCRQFYAVFAALDGVFWRSRRHSRDVPPKIAPLLRYDAAEYAGSGNLAVLECVYGWELDLSAAEAAIQHDRVDVIRKMPPCGDFIAEYLISAAVNADAVRCFTHFVGAGLVKQIPQFLEVSKISKLLKEHGHAFTAPPPDSYQTLEFYERDPAYWGPIDFADGISFTVTFCGPAIVSHALKYAHPAAVFDEDTAADLLAYNSELEIVTFVILTKLQFRLAKLQIDMSAMVFAAYPKITRICRESGAKN